MNADTVGSGTTTTTNLNGSSLPEKVNYTSQASEAGKPIFESLNAIGSLEAGKKLKFVDEEGEKGNVIHIQVRGGSEAGNYDDLKMKTFCQNLKTYVQDRNCSLEDLLLIKKVIGNSESGALKGLQTLKNTYKEWWKGQRYGAEIDATEKEFKQALTLIEQQIDIKEHARNQAQREGIEKLIKDNKTYKDDLSEIVSQLKDWGVLDQNIMEEKSELYRLTQALRGIEEKHLSSENKYLILANCIKERAVSKEEKASKDKKELLESKETSLNEKILKFCGTLEEIKEKNLTLQKKKQSIEKAIQKDLKISLPDKNTASPKEASLAQGLKEMHTNFHQEMAKANALKTDQVATLSLSVASEEDLSLDDFVKIEHSPEELTKEEIEEKAAYEAKKLTIRANADGLTSEFAKVQKSGQNSLKIYNLSRSLEHMAAIKPGEKLVFQPGGIIKCEERGLIARTFGPTRFYSDQLNITNLAIFADSLSAIPLSEISYRQLKEILRQITSANKGLDQLKSGYSKDYNKDVIDYAQENLNKFENSIAERLKEIGAADDFSQVIAEIEKQLTDIDLEDRESKITLFLETYGAFDRKEILQSLIDNSNPISELLMTIARSPIDRETKLATASKIISENYGYKAKITNLNLAAKIPAKREAAEKALKSNIEAQTVFLKKMQELTGDIILVREQVGVNKQKEILKACGEKFEGLDIAIHNYRKAQEELEAKAKEGETQAIYIDQYLQSMGNQFGEEFITIGKHIIDDVRGNPATYGKAAATSFLLGGLGPMGTLVVKGTVPYIAKKLGVEANEKTLENIKDALTGYLENKKSQADTIRVIAGDNKEIAEALITTLNNISSFYNNSSEFVTGLLLFSSEEKDK